MYQLRARRLRATFVCLALAVCLSACTRSLPEPVTVPPYQPRYTYAPTATASEQGVSVAVVSPVVESEIYGEDGAGMLHGLSSGLASLVIARGAEYRGTFGKLDEMPLADKRATDLVVYIALGVDVGWNAQSTYSNRGGTLIRDKEVHECAFEVFSKGDAAIVVAEPLSGEILWRKTVAVDVKPAALTETQYNHCTSSAAAHIWHRQQQIDIHREPALGGHLGNAYRRELEATFVAIMQGVEGVLRPSELGTVLKPQALALKAAKGS